MTEADKQLVERLREWHRFRQEVDAACGGEHHNTPQLASAADRIESLSAENARLRDALQTIAAHVAIQPDAVAKAIEATCRAALSPNTAEEK